MFTITVLNSLRVNAVHAAYYGVQCEALVYSWFYLIMLSVAKIPGT
jgi:hypothetical protein